MELETYTSVKRSIHQILNLDLEHYKDEQMRRRLDSWLVRCGAPDWNTYFHRLRNDATELSRFRNYLTINVSAFFRDLERWHSLRTEILPDLIRAILPTGMPGSGLKIWSAGCSIGAEPYSLAMLLEEVSPGRKHRLLATDIDQGALDKARCGGPYTAEEVQNLTPGQKASYLEPGGPPYYIKASLAKKIEFQEHNLFTDAAPTNLDLIICRNVVIYFTATAKDALYKKFHAALRPGGIFFVGATEIVPRPQEIGLRSHGISFYMKA